MRQGLQKRYYGVADRHVKPGSHERASALPDGLIVEERFERYVRDSGGDRNAAAGLYVWNLQISEAFSTPLHVYEVVLRNSIDKGLTAVTGQEDWWNAASIRWRPAQQGALDAAMRSVNQSQRGQGTHGHIVAELPLGFWTATVSRRYQRQWDNGLKDAFPGHKGDQTSLHQRLDRIRNLRNRIAHHEPIYFRNLIGDNRDVHTVLAAIDPKASLWVREHSRVSDVISQRPSAAPRRPGAAPAQQSQTARPPMPGTAPRHARRSP